MLIRTDYELSCLSMASTGMDTHICREMTNLEQSPLLIEKQSKLRAGFVQVQPGWHSFFESVRNAFPQPWRTQRRLKHFPWGEWGIDRPSLERANFRLSTLACGGATLMMHSKNNGQVESAGGLRNRIFLFVLVKRLSKMRMPSKSFSVVS